MNKPSTQQDHSWSTCLLANRPDRLPDTDLHYRVIVGETFTPIMFAKPPAMIFSRRHGSTTTRYSPTDPSRKFIGLIH